MTFEKRFYMRRFFVCEFLSFCVGWQWACGRSVCNGAAFPPLPAALFLLVPRGAVGDQPFAIFTFLGCGGLGLAPISCLLVSDLTLCVGLALCFGGVGERPLALFAVLGCGELGLAPISGLLVSELTPVAPPRGGVCDPPLALLAVLGCGGLGLAPISGLLVSDVTPEDPPRGGVGNQTLALLVVEGFGSSLFLSPLWGFLPFLSLWLHEGEWVTSPLTFLPCLVVGC